MHGGVVGIAMFGPNLAALSEKRKVILPGLTHYNISSSPALATVVPPFLDTPTPGPK